MKKLLVSLLLVGLILGNINIDANHRHTKVKYHDIPMFMYVDNYILKRILICAACSAKYMTYSFDDYEDEEVIAFVAYSDKCEFYLKFDKVSHDIEVEFNAEDDSFNYHKFIQVFDSIFYV